MSLIKKILEKIGNFFNNRYLILSIITFLVSIVFIIRLFNLQIVDGKEYREKSERRMLRTEVITAPRGEIVDRNGVILATSKLSFNVELYKVNVTAEEQNDALVKLIKILEENGDAISSSFPINDSKSGFNFESQEEENKWKEEMGFDTSLDFNQVIEKYIEKFELSAYDRDTQIKIIQIKYEGNLNGYSLFTSATIAKNISEKSHALIEEDIYELYGVNIVSVPIRYYPNGNFASHILGYVGKISNTEYKEKKDEGYNVNSIVGKSGVELSFEKYLKGEDGENKVETDLQGNTSTKTTTKKAVAGNTLTLTIDYRLQKAAEESLKNTISGLNDGTLVGKTVADADAGAVVVLDVKTGEVLAMASYPDYDINSLVRGLSSEEWNKLNNDPLKPMYNRTISGRYSPGSTYKMLVGIAGLMNNKITVDEKILDPGIYPYGHKPKCWIYSYYGMTHGYVNLTEALKGSCNCYFYEVGRRIGIDEIVKYSKMFGLGEKTGIELDNEAKGSIAGENRKDSEWYLGMTLSAAIGQSDNAYTPIQLANYISTIANGGTLNKVSIIKKVTNEETSQDVSMSEIEEYTSNYTGVNFETKKTSIDPSYINAIKEGMRAVTNDMGGTSYSLFKDSQIEVAGKTGTSQLGNGSNNGIFVGFAPYDDPEIAVVAIIENGAEGTYTAHVVRPIMDEYFNISTDEKNNEKQGEYLNKDVKF
mgnify:FL=1